jgi:flagellar hook-associated protein 3 FlgL
MSIGPIFPGRIPNSLNTAAIQDYLQTDNQQLMKLQQQIATGQKLQVPSDDPIAASQTLALQGQLTFATTAQTNVQTDNSLLGATDSALGSISTLLNSAKSLVMQGIGSDSTATQKQALADQVGSLIQQAVNLGNTQFRGRYLFGGSNSSQPPFSVQADGSVLYTGDSAQLQSIINSNTTITTNIDGVTAFGAQTPPVSGNLNPALTLSTQLKDLNGGQGAKLGPISITLQSGLTTQTQTVDLTGAQTIQDVQTRIQNAFGGPLTVSVGVDPSTHSGLVLTPSSGTVSVSEVANGNTAGDLGIKSGPVAAIHGSDVNPQITLETKLSDLNGGAGVSTTGGLLITNGGTTQAVNISGDVTVQDLINTLNQANLNLNVGINSAGNGIAISSKLSGSNFSIGENGGTSAADLGVRTLDGSTSLSSLNLGTGVPVKDGVPLQITRRDGTSVSVNLQNALTVQDVINSINAVDPGHLVASLKTTGNGIQITDDSGTGPLTVAGNPEGSALGLVGTESSGNPANPLVGTDINPQSSGGVFDTLVRLQGALTQGNNAELTRLNGVVDTLTSQVSATRGVVGGRIQTLTAMQTALQTQTLQIQQSLSDVFDTDVTSAVTQLAALQASFSATLRVASQSFQMNLAQYL